MANEPTEPNANHKKGVPWLLLFRFGVTITLVIFLISSVGLTNIAEILPSLNPVMGFVAACGLLLFHLIGAFNIWILLKEIHPIPFVTMMKVYVYSWAVSLITPGQLGDASLILFLKKNKIPFKCTGPAYVIDKVITLAVFFVISLYGCNLFLSINAAHLFGAIVFGIIVAAILFLSVGYLLSKFHFFKALKKLLSEMIDEVRVFRNKYKILLINLFMTIVKWLCVSLVFFTGFLSFDVFVGWPDIAVIPIMSTLIGYIPISVAGIGTVEITATYLFSKIGVEGSAVLSAYLLLRALQYFLASLTILCFGRIKQTN